jgi:hypothetical protein
MSVWDAGVTGQTIELISQMPGDIVAFWIETFALVET